MVNYVLSRPRTPFSKPIKRGDWTISTHSTTTAFTTWLSSGGKPESKIPVFIPWIISAPTT